MATYSPAPAPRRASRNWLWPSLAVVLLVLGLAIGRWVIPASGSAATSTPPSATGGSGGVGAPHGPSTVTQGVPSGYTHDQAGAATAAVNAVQLVGNLAHGQADPATAGKTWPASSAEAAARTALSSGPDGNTGDQTTKVPVSTRVTAYSDGSATVEVWVVAVGSTSGVGANTSAGWSTHTVGLVWQSGDWKVASLKAVTGPQPGSDAAASSTTTPLTNGLYSYYIN
jgi:hypothetical protein